MKSSHIDLKTREIRFKTRNYPYFREIIFEIERLCSKIEPSVMKICETVDGQGKSPGSEIYEFTLLRLGFHQSGLLKEPDACELTLVICPQASSLNSVCS